MPQRLRKLIGVFISVAFVVFYALFAMVLAQRVVPGTSGLFQAVFYFVLGMAWIVPVGLLVRWMQRPDATDS